MACRFAALDVDSETNKSWPMLLGGLGSTIPDQARPRALTPFARISPFIYHYLFFFLLSFSPTCADRNFLRHKSGVRRRPDWCVCSLAYGWGYFCRPFWLGRFFLLLISCVSEFLCRSQVRLCLGRKMLLTL